MTAVTFEAWPKIGRLYKPMVISEKIDGTQAAFGVTPIGDDDPIPAGAFMHVYDPVLGLAAVHAQSRKRLITPDNDNFGFAEWVAKNAHELVKTLGSGLHFGEWWGSGIQRGYGLDHKRFSLFNTHRWSWLNDPIAREAREIHSQLWCVPVLTEWEFDTREVRLVLQALQRDGSAAARGFMDPEGIVVFHTASRTPYKVTYDGDQAKGSVVRGQLALAA